jgi:hypothetical protein
LTLSRNPDTEDACFEKLLAEVVFYAKIVLVQNGRGGMSAPSVQPVPRRTRTSSVLALLRI